MVEIRLPRRPSWAEPAPDDYRCPAVTEDVPAGANGRCQRSLNHAEDYDGTPHLVPWRRADKTLMGRTWTDDDPTTVDVEADPWYYFNDERAPRGAWATACPSEAWEEYRPPNPWPRVTGRPVRPRREVPRDRFMPPGFRG